MFKAFVQKARRIWGRRYWVTLLWLLRCVSRELSDLTLARFDRGWIAGRRAAWRGIDRPVEGTSSSRMRLVRHSARGGCVRLRGDVRNVRLIAVMMTRELVLMVYPLSR